MLGTVFSTRFGIDHPICLAGMGSQGRATPPGLVAAVSEAGGMGFIGGSNLDAVTLRRVIRDVRQRTSRPIGVHLVMPRKEGTQTPDRGRTRRDMAARFPRHVAEMEHLLARFGLTETVLGDSVPISQAATADGGVAGPLGTPEQVFHEQLDAIFSEDVQIVGGAMGSIKVLSDRARGRGVAVLGLATSRAQAIRHEADGADFVVAQGAEAGGHVGRIGTLTLLPQVVDAVGIPVLAAGGISDGRGLAASLALGATAAWIGTAFLLATECAIPEAHKQQILAGRSEDFPVNSIFSGLPMRAYRNALIYAWEAAGLPLLPAPYQKVLMDDFNAAAAAAGRWDLHSNPAGEGAGLLTAIRPAAEIVSDMVDGARRALSRLPEARP